MDVTETFERENVYSQEIRQLPATIYNQTYLLLTHTKKKCVFVPIRSMQYIAVIDKEEIIFVDASNKRFVQISWQQFTSQIRQSLTDPVPYHCVYYYPDGKTIMQRLQGEYSKALNLLVDKISSPLTYTSSVTKIK